MLHRGPGTLLDAPPRPGDAPYAPPRPRRARPARDLSTYRYAAVKVGVKSVAPSLNDRAVVGLPLALITAIALVIDDVGVVVSLTGALMGSAVLLPRRILF